jgi:hypothetical protein
MRRDLTINAIAEDEQGNIIDPYGGRQDIESRKLRHVSAAFVEDPVRVLRVARFAARFHKLGFTLAPETRELIRQMGSMKTILRSSSLPCANAKCWHCCFPKSMPFTGYRRPPDTIQKSIPASMS